MADLTSLIERIEAATEGSRELDGCIFIAVNIPPEKVGRIDQIDGCVGWWPKGAPYVSAIEVPRYSTSIDAALTLLPEGWSILSAWNGRDAICTVHLKPLGDPTGLWPPASKAKSQALALLAAILRARQTEGRG